MSSATAENSPSVAPLTKESSAESSKGTASPAEPTTTSDQRNSEKPKEEKGQTTIFQLASEIEESLNALQKEMQTNEKEFLATINKIEQQLNPKGIK